MLMRTVRWMVAVVIASAMVPVGCGEQPKRQRIPRPMPAPVDRLDRSVVHAFDVETERRLLDRFELDNFLRDRNIRVRVVDGTVVLTGEVWTPLEKERAGELVRAVPGVVDVSNELDIHAPR